MTITRPSFASEKASRSVSHVQIWNRIREEVTADALVEPALSEYLRVAILDHEHLEDALSHIKTPMSLSVLGCVVNGPGEARETDIGITGGGNGRHMVYLSGVTDHHVEDADMIAHIVKLVEAKAAEIDAGSAVSMDTLHGKAA